MTGRRVDRFFSGLFTNDSILISSGVEPNNMRLMSLVLMVCECTNSKRVLSRTELTTQKTTKNSLVCIRPIANDGTN